MSSCSEASKAGAVPTPKNKSKNFTLSLNECFPTVYFYTPVAVCIAFERECEGWEGRNEDRQGKTGQGGGVAECHPVIGESARLFSELGVWIERGSSGRNKPALIYTRLSSSERCQSDTTEEKGVWWENATKAILRFIPKQRPFIGGISCILLQRGDATMSGIFLLQDYIFFFFHTGEMTL